MGGLRRGLAVTRRRGDGCNIAHSIPCRSPSPLDESSVPRPPINLHQKVREVLQHTSSLLPEADRPIQHFERSVNAGLLLLNYIDDHIDPNDVYEAVYDRHLGHLRRMVLAELIESVERFLKELASVCVDSLAPYTTDDRFDVFVPKRSDKIAAFVNAPSIGKTLCESDTWINNSTINTDLRPC